MRKMLFGICLLTYAYGTAAVAGNQEQQHSLTASSTYYFESGSLVGQQIASCDGGSKQWGSVPVSVSENVVVIYECTRSAATRIEFGADTSAWVRTNFCSISNACAYGPVPAPAPNAVNTGM